MNLNPKVSVLTLIIALCLSYFLLPKFDDALSSLSRDADCSDDKAFAKISKISSNEEIPMLVKDAKCTSLRAVVGTQKDIHLLFDDEGGWSSFKGKVVTSREGISYRHVIAAVNWWRKVSAPAGTQVTKFDLVDERGSNPESDVYVNPDFLSTKSYFLKKSTDTATGELAHTDVNHFAIYGRWSGVATAAAFEAVFKDHVLMAIIPEKPNLKDRDSLRMFLNLLSDKNPEPVKNNQSLNVQEDGSKTQLNFRLSDVPPPSGVPYNIVVKPGSPGTPWVKLYRYKKQKDDQ